MTGVYGALFISSICRKEKAAFTILAGVLFTFSLLMSGATLFRYYQLKSRVCDITLFPKGQESVKYEDAIVEESRVIKIYDKTGETHFYSIDTNYIKNEK